jgi:hypothetical protein
MEIHLVSSLTPDDESRLAPQMLAAIGGILDGLPVSYSVRIETAVGNAIHHTRTPASQATGDSAAPAVTGSSAATGGQRT